MIVYFFTLLYCTKILFIDSYQIIYLKRTSFFCQSTDETVITTTWTFLLWNFSVFSSVFFLIAKIAQIKKYAEFID